MKLALVGYGKMGKTIEQIALKRGHEISYRISIDNAKEINLMSPKNTDIAMEFSTPGSAFRNVQICLKNQLPTISGSTGWIKGLSKVRKLCEDLNGTFLYASNFSLGVNIFSKVNRLLASIMDRHSEYDISVEETHHINKKDKPSGTAISLSEDIIKNITRKSQWTLNTPMEGDLFITSNREKEVPGTHRVTYENNIDRITIEHESKSRNGFALGAVLVAEWIKDKKGFLTMNDYLNL